jgi:hypothetical protein
MLRVGAATASIVITSYQHGRFLRPAIDSALAQTGSRVEVIVVDDGSTDESPHIIESYGEAVRALCREHRGQAQAMVDGWRVSTGEAVLFLDGDDLLYPDALARMCLHFRPGVAKVQGRLDLIDEGDRRLGRQTPPMALLSGDLASVVLRHGWYPAPPTSGNAFARATLDALLPVPEEYARLAKADGRLTVSDHYLSVLAALEGEVVSLPEPVGAYRLHPAPKPWPAAAVVADARRRIACTIALTGIVGRRATERGLATSAALALGTPNHFKERLASRVVDPRGHPVASDTRCRLVRAGIAAAWRAPWSPLRMRVAQSLGFLALAALPRAAVAPILPLLLVDHERPRWLSRLAGMEV